MQFLYSIDHRYFIPIGIRLRRIAFAGLRLYRPEAISVSDPGRRFVDVKKMLLLK